MPNKQEVWIIKSDTGEYWGRGQRWVLNIDDAIYYFSHENALKKAPPGTLPIDIKRAIVTTTLKEV